MEAESDLELIKECGFSSFDEVVQRINELVNIMRVGRIKAEKNLDRFQNQAKIYLKDGQRDKAKKELAKKKKKEEKIKTFDNQFNVILEKIKEVKNINQMQQVLNATKYCNNLLLAELSQEETGEPTEGVKEYQDLLENDNNNGLIKTKVDQFVPLLKQNMRNENNCFKFENYIESHQQLITGKRKISEENINENDIIQKRRKQREQNRNNKSN